MIIYYHLLKMYVRKHERHLKPHSTTFVTYFWQITTCNLICFYSHKTISFNYLIALTVVTSVSGTSKHKCNRMSLSKWEKSTIMQSDGILCSNKATCWTCYCTVLWLLMEGDFRCTIMTNSIEFPYTRVKLYVQFVRWTSWKPTK